MTRLYGRVPRGERLVDHAPHGRWETTIFIAALRTDGLAAPMAADGAVNGDLLLAYVCQQLVPEFRPGDVVVMDNLSSYKVKGVRETIEAACGEVAYLPPYSPDLIPIEQVYAKLKALLHKAAERTVEGLWQRIGQLVDAFSKDECRNYIRNCGYRIH